LPTRGVILRPSIEPELPSARALEPRAEVAPGQAGRRAKALAAIIGGARLANRLAAGCES